MAPPASPHRHHDAPPPAGATDPALIRIVEALARAHARADYREAQEQGRMTPTP
jgi:hypothetical protein